MRRKVSHVACGRFSALQVGKMARRKTLFGEMALPVRVEKTSASASVLTERAFHSRMNCSAASESGI